jgi:hypothetical protein
LDSGIETVSLSPPLSSGSLRIAWRPLNLQAAPFHFPDPLALIDEKCTEDDGVYADKQLGLWSLSDIPVRKYI